MVSLSVDDQEPFQYNYWNWLHEKAQLHLLKNDYSIGHILYTGSVTVQGDGSVKHSSKYHPKECVLNFYFGGSK
jgi:hypothetical protein